MLAEAHRRVSRGEDVVIGLIEPHGRPATAELLEGLEQIPLKAIEYRGRTFYELDTDAILKRRPEWVLIDELAHTNVPGAKHEKRWQSIEELRDAGINIITTVNVQHLESLNDAVFEITGVRVRETVPDWVVDSADEIELVDLTPDARHQPPQARRHLQGREHSAGAGELLQERAISSRCGSWRCARRRRTSTSSSRRWCRRPPAPDP